MAQHGTVWHSMIQYMGSMQQPWTVVGLAQQSSSVGVQRSNPRLSWVKAATLGCCGFNAATLECCGYNTATLDCSGSNTSTLDCCKSNAATLDCCGSTAATSDCCGSNAATLHCYGSNAATLDWYWPCRQEGKPGPQDPTQEVFLAFGRVFSGVLRDGQSVHVLSAAYNPMQPHLQRQVLQVSQLQLPLMMFSANNHIVFSKYNAAYNPMQSHLQRQVL